MIMGSNMVNSEDFKRQQSLEGVQIDKDMEVESLFKQIDAADKEIEE